MEPAAVYGERLATWRDRAAHARRRELLLANTRLAVFGAGVVAIVLILRAGAAAVAWCAVPIAVFGAAVSVHGSWRRARERAERAVAHYEAGLARLAYRFDGAPLAPPAPVDDHPYAAHLDLFERGGLFARLSHARSCSGRQTLAGWLLEPAPPEEIRARQQAVDALRGRVDLREDLAMIDAQIVAALDATGVAAWGESPAAPARRTRVAAAGLAAAAVLGLVIAPWAGGLPLAVVVAAQLVLAARVRRRVNGIVEAAEHASADLGLVAPLLARLEAESFAEGRLAVLRRALDTGGRPPSSCVRALLRRVDALDWRANQMFALVAPLLLWTTQWAFAIEAWRARFGPRLRGWIAAVGEFEALLDLSAFAFESPGDPFPEIVDDGPHLDARGVAHPLLRDATPNDVALGPDRQLLIVTGSNMSGKSTLLRALGVNVVLAQAGAPVRAASMILSPLSVAASIRTLDSLADGASRFLAEITALRRVVEGTRGPRPVLFLLDEMLAGTNSHDRLAGAAALIRGLLDRGAIGLVTTHDLALARLSDEWGTRATNTHFECRLDDGELRFDYTLRPGVVRESNALALMRAVGLDV